MSIQFTPQCVVKALYHDISGDCYTIFRSSIQTLVTNHARTKILSRAPRGFQNAIEGQGMDLGTRGTATRLVFLSASRSTHPR